MDKKIRTTSSRLKKIGSLRIGLKESAAISRIEGLVMSREMTRMFKGFEKTGKAHEERRAALKDKFGKVVG
jgi:hypothetical protein